MERIKRQQTDTIHDYNNNKKPKLENKITTINVNKSRFEDLANEILYEIFEYLGIYHVYEGFLNLNKRFQNLLVNSNLPIQINISTISKSNFEYYHKNLILPNKHRINVLRLSNPFTVDIIFSPPRILSKFVQLETLILDNINAKYLNNILKHSIHLPKLHSLDLNLAEYVQSPTLLFCDIFRLSKLKHCKITYRDKNEYNPYPIHFSECDHSPIEYLVINTRFPLDTFNDLLSCLPQLHHLSINCLVESRYIMMEKELRSIELKCLKYVSFNLHSIRFNQLEDLIKNYFRCVEVLRLTMKYDAYLDAKKWEQLISSYMPNLRIFDINHIGFAKNNSLTYHDLINQFNSSFWNEKQWFFTHQHDWQESLDSGIFYSTDPYRRKDFEFYWQMDKQLCPYIQPTNLNSVKHVYIHSKKATDNSVNYFPNATELTIKYCFKTPNDLISTSLNRVIPLEKLTKLVIQSYYFSFEEIVKLLYFTPNLHTLEFYFLCLYDLNLNSIPPTAIFQYVSNTNKIKKLDLNGSCTLENMQLIVNLFPKLEYLKTRMNRKQIEQIIRFLLSKTNPKTCHLFFLCISEAPKIWLRKLNMLIKLQNLLDSYLIKFVNRDLYLWW